MRRTAAAALLLFIAARGAKTDASADLSAPATANETWTVDSLEFLRVTGIATVDSRAPLTGIKGIARLPDDGVVVADGRTSTLECFNAEGEYARTVGKRNASRTALARLTNVLHCGDSLYVPHFAQRHYQVLSTEGVGGRTFALAVDSAGAIATLAACNADGVFINYSEAILSDSPNQSQAVRVAGSFWISSATVKWQASLGTHPGVKRWFAKSASAESLDHRPFAHAPFIAVGRTRASTGAADSFVINVYALNGATVGVIRKPMRVPHCAAADIERYQLNDTIGRTKPQIAVRMNRWTSIDFPNVAAVYTAMVVDSADNLWVRAHPPASDGWVE